MAETTQRLAAGEVEDEAGEHTVVVLRGNRKVFLWAGWAETDYEAVELALHALGVEFTDAERVAP